MGAHVPRKRFGQHFLVDAHILSRIVDALGPRPGDPVIEIGPGLGALTRPLVAALGHLTAIELDRDLAARLRAEFPPAQLTLVEADALQVDFATLGSGLRLVGNLPYNISSPLLFRLVPYLPHLRDAHFMLQREVVDRMAAPPGGKEYGRLSVMLQARFAIEKLFDVPAEAFDPPPRVVSAVVRLTPLGAAAPAIADEAVFARAVAAAFSQRRKTLRNAWKLLLSGDEIGALNIDPGARGETVAVEDYARAANYLAARGPL
ncbi:MAG: 16S rRNA (adenine(1518)-N(6)/adenine(1519)-N(6))-dimethyltransferase RsmA [Burkholderiales bacterium]